MRAALVDRNNNVVNVILLPDGWTGAAGEWPLPAGLTLVESDEAGTGDRFENGKFTRVEPTPSSELSPKEIARLRALIETPRVPR